MMRAGTKRSAAGVNFYDNQQRAHDKTSVCYDYHQYGQKVAAGQRLKNDAFSLYLFTG